ncbi:M56 family metallopeptidase [Maritalea porphyrae]|uniref:M56 family metallopeptidase n=2 Tax=Maritalea TaxID=623276 RepID=UPI0022B029F6|nr:M56 family metallopeptidase [Maritalea porphyrae]MCZ4272503.1 M56 family metallopeptidase [Maritalea porphyrae]
MVSALVNYYIDVNIALLATFGVWITVRFGLSRIGYRFSFQSEQNLIIAFIGLAVLAPVLVRVGSGLLPAHANVTDLLVSWYLGGGVDMSARQFQSLIGAKGAAVDELIHRDSWVTLLGLGLGAAAFGFFVARLGANAVSLHSILNNSFPLKKLGRVQVVASDRVEVPFTTRGWRSFYVVMPVAMIGDAWKMRIAIAHEMQHIRHGDVTWEYVWSLVHPLMFWNPAFSMFRKRLNVLRELLCDAALLSRQTFNKRRYCETLLSVAKNMAQTKARNNALAVPFVEPKRHLARRGQSSLEYRILYALELPSARKSLRFGHIGLMLTMSLAAMLILLLLQQPSEWSHDRIMLSTIANLEHLESLNSSSK